MAPTPSALELSQRVQQAKPSHFENKVIAGRNFCNKLWNISRFISEKVGDIKSEKRPEAFSPADHWIVRELDRAISELDNHMQNYRFAEASETVYHTIWSTVADWYIEASKTQQNPELLAWVLETCLKIAHPFAPFVTETICKLCLGLREFLQTKNLPNH